MCLFRKSKELVDLKIEYDRSIIAEGVLSWQEKKLHQERMRQLEIDIAELRQEVESLLSRITH